MEMLARVKKYANTKDVYDTHPISTGPKVEKKPKSWK